VAIEINNNYCSSCTVCRSVCPFEAVFKDESTGEIKIDVEKCQVCGLCSSACPAQAIDLVYYDDDSLVSYTKKLMKQKRSKTLVLTCRGSSPAPCEMVDVLKEKGIRSFVSLRLPCVGRVSPEFLLRTLAQGTNKIVVMHCEEGFCRFKKGSKVNANRLILTQALLSQLGFKEDTLSFLKNSNKTVYDTQKCVGCDKCTFICPYEAIEAQPLATPQINQEKCVGCGACALVCPHLAIQLKGFEYEPVSQQVLDCGARANKLKSEGVKPVVLVFCCQWSEFSALDTINPSSLPENVMLLEIPCFKGLDPVHVIEAFYAGFDGVLAVTCAEKDCKLKEGREIAELNAAILKKTLNKLHLDDRFEVCTTSPRYVGDFNSKLENFLKKVSSSLKVKEREQ
jgi:coenzyme F420-reducing hydrogenase delta subunit